MKGNFEHRLLGNKEWSWTYDGVYAKPNIPRKKLMNAISSYAAGVRPDEVLLLLDDTVFGGAKDGMLLTSNAIFAHELLESAKMIALTDIEAIGMEATGKVIINGRLFFTATGVGHLALLTVTSRISGALAKEDNFTADEKNDELAEPSGGGKKDETSDYGEELDGHDESSKPVLTEKGYQLNFINSDEKFSQIKKFRNLSRATTVVGLLLLGGEGNGSPRPLDKITEEFVKAIHKCVFEFRNIFIERRGCAQLANDFSTIEVVCFSAVRLFKDLQRFNAPEAVLTVLLHKGIPESIFSDADAVKKFMAIVLGIYFEEEEEEAGESLTAFSARLYVDNKEQRLMVDQPSVYSYVIDREAGQMCNQFRNFADDYDRELHEFDKFVKSSSIEFSQLVFNTLNRR